ncbi:DUF3224 domain-containing protein [Pedococcus bigeumensis]|uniref:DUF3224 domain-containing protein n=1 Tax=Pedococcus bigeumensis TaxID=433644 RepID=UPI0031D3A5CB
MRAEGTFTVESFVPATLDPAPAEVSTSLPVGVAVLVKQFSGGVEGRSSTIFTAAFDQASGVGTYVAMESFQGSLAGAEGAFNFTHGATTTGADRVAEHFVVVPGSGTGDLTGIAGAGGLAVEEDGTHRIWFDYAL